ncbi:DUF559 domain-containing protein [Mycolicibacterium komossense]|uniref:DUF559 domain-containing protein n=1 Tax=Mycolicibacterium komossense TaxID=1779 RepID=A0ABT3CM03_9MYCO|nr:DUF559 domain-containing protein [Mycolicibacterium komossense]
MRNRYRAVYRDVYVPNDAKLTAADRARAAWLWAAGDCILTGISAAAVLGTKWLDDDRPAELVRVNRHSPPGIVVRSYGLTADETCRRRGMHVTTPPRTAFDIGRTLPARQGIPILDALVQATGIKPSDVMAVASTKRGVRGVRRLRDALELVDGGAESPQESRLRLLLVGAGLPKPETQIEFFDDFGEAFIRVDMGWRQWQVAVEYDGIQHWADPQQRAWDIERITLLEAMGWVVIRVSARMMSRPLAIVERVRAKLRAVGCPI